MCDVIFDKRLTVPPLFLSGKKFHNLFFINAMINKRTHLAAIDFFNLSSRFAGMVEITSGTSLGMKPIVTIEEGTKVWHLVSIICQNNETSVNVLPKVFSEIIYSTIN